MSGLFLVDYVIRWLICDDRKKFMTRFWNIADVVVILTPVLGYFLPKGTSGIVRGARIYRLLVIAKRVWDKRRHRFFESSNVKWVAVIALSVIFLATLALWAQETQHAGGNIHSPWDAAWWAIVTMFTVGYGDTFPHTVVGRIAAFFVMFAGIALFGWATGALASKFVESETEVEATRQRDRMRHQLDDMTHQLGRVERAIAALSGGQAEVNGDGRATAAS